MKKIELTGPEAGIALSVLVAFSDDNPSMEETAVMRKYYKFDDAESFQNKLNAVGYKFPNDLSAIEPKILETLKKEDKNFQLRTIAVGLILAHSDGVFDQNEMNVLNKFCGALEFSLYEADLFSKNRLKEIDEVTGYNDYKDASTEIPFNMNIVFTPEEAGAAFSILVGLIDDDPSDEEAAVMREYFSVQVISSLMSKLADSGIEYPDGLLSTKKFIFTALSRAERDTQKKYLAIAYKVAGADGVCDESELALLQEYCEEYGIGIVELKDYFKTTIA